MNIFERETSYPLKPKKNMKPVGTHQKLENDGTYGSSSYKYQQIRDVQSLNFSCNRRRVPEAIMDCCICGPMANYFKPPRNSICSSCYEGAKGMMAFINELDGDQDAGFPTNSRGFKPNISKAISSFLILC